jgi:hypothetical protein
MTFRRLDRRTFLRGAGGVALSLPFLEAMRPRTARAQATDTPKRLVILYNTQGVLMDSWAPTGSAGNYNFGPILSQLDQHKQDMVVLTGINDETCLLNPANAHERAPAHLLTGKRMTGTTHRDAGAASIDHVIAERISPAGLPIKSLHLGANNPAAEFCFTGPRAPVDRINDPRQAYNLLFSGFTPPMMGGNEPDPALVRRRLRQQTVLDSVKDETSRVRSTLGANDKHTLDAYLTRIGEIERRIGSTSAPPAGPGCSPAMPALTRSPYRTRPQPATFYPFYDPDVASRAMMDIATMALACDRTRVVTMAWNQPNIYEWLRDASDNPIIVDDWHQDIVHVGGGTLTTPTTPQRNYLRTVQSYYHGELNYMLSALKGVTEGDGTLLDNTLVLYVNEFSDGARHSHLGKPYFIAGKCGGSIQTGRWLNFDGVPHNRLLLSVLRAFGFDDAVVGETDYCSDGPLTGLV